MPMGHEGAQSVAQCKRKPVALRITSEALYGKCMRPVVVLLDQIKDILSQNKQQGRRASAENERERRLLRGGR
jgi:hypothetical protein